MLFLHFTIIQQNFCNVPCVFSFVSMDKRAILVSPRYTTQISTNFHQNSSRQTIRHLLTPQLRENLSAGERIIVKFTVLWVQPTLERESRRIINVHLESNPFHLENTTF